MHLRKISDVIGLPKASNDVRRAFAMAISCFTFSQLGTVMPACFSAFKIPPGASVIKGIPAVADPMKHINT